MINPLDYIRRHGEGVISLPKGEDDILRLDCVVTVLDGSTIEVEMALGEMTVEELDSREACYLHFDAPDNVICMVTTIIETISDKDMLRLHVLEIVSRAQKRRYFRVPTTVPVDLQAQLDKGAFSLTGKTLNISACGVLVAFSRPLKYQRRVWMEISLPAPISREVRCIAQVVRLDEQQDGKYLSAFSFDKVLQDDQEALISFCLEEQRRQLRLKVRVGW